MKPREARTMRKRGPPSQTRWESMPRVDLEKLLACPVCKIALSRKKHSVSCKFKGIKIQSKNRVWDFLTPINAKTKSQIANERMHNLGPWERISDGSYEILAAFAKGNKTVDIACGDGYIEELAPQTVGVDFSISALTKAKNRGAKYLVCANAENLPFVNNAFDLSISAGSLENIENPQKAIFEMARISKIQIMTVHREFDFPFARQARNIATKLFNINHQPVEKPQKQNELESMLKKAKLHIIFKGFWTLPTNYGKVVKFLPEFQNIPACSFFISIKM